MQALKHLCYICFKVAFKTPVSIAIALDTTMTDEITKIRILGCLCVDLVTTKKRAIAIGAKTAAICCILQCFFGPSLYIGSIAVLFRTTTVVLVFCVRTYVNHVTNICQYRIG